jgi:tRNA A-37 threonylcarbamoyl transferase component Bud32
MAARDLVGSLVVTRYRVISKVAAGATADVYEAEHVKLGSHVALKVLANNDASSEVAARFLREGKTMGMFRHPNIVELLEVGRLEDGHLFLATEMVRGPSLRELIQKRSIDPRRALTIAREVLDALGHAHGMGIVHRGMRPENVMITDEGRVKVLDFGVAKLATDTAAVMGENKLTRTGIAVLGDPRYSAPEVARGGNIDARADIYAVGAMLKEVISAPSTPQLQMLLADATQANPDLRYRTAAEMRDAVDMAIASLDEQDPIAAAGVVATPASAATSMSAGWALDDAAPAPPKVAEPAPPATPNSMSQPPSRPSRPSGGYLPGVTERPSSPHIAPVAAAPSQPYVAPPQPASISADPLFTASPQVPTVPATHPGPWTGEANLTASEAARTPMSITPKRPGKSLDVVALAKQHRWILAGVLGAIVLVVILVMALGGDGAAKKTATGEDGKALLKRGHDEFAAGHRDDAMSLYERAIVLDKSLATNPEIRQNATSVVEGKSAIAAVIALELLASRVSPAAKDVIAATAATGKNGDVRRRALAIAERDGFAGEIDRVASLSLDLAQATTCEDRRAVIGKLRATKDKRAVAPLKKAKVYKCVERDASDAIAELEATP